MRLVIWMFVLAVLSSSCVIIRPDEVAVKQKLGKLKEPVVTEGVRIHNPLISRFTRVPTRIINKKIELDIPSKEGLTIGSEMSILYRVEKDKVVTLLREVGPNFEEDLIAPVFRSALANVSARFMAKDMHTGERSVIEKEVRRQMLEELSERGIIIEAVLMKRISLPRSLSDAIEEKLAAEQEAQRMEFVLQRERQEAERRRIEAEGTRDAQKILDAGLTPEVLQFRAIETFRELSNSPNAKVLFFNGQMPFMLEGVGE